MANQTLDLNLILRARRKQISDTAKDASEIIAFIGNTGCGKSTLIKFLTKDKSLKIEENAQNDYLFIDAENTISGADAESFESKTLLPNLTRDEETGCAIGDCAGFNDTRSQEMDLLAAFMNREFLRNAKKIKIVIVENNSNLKLGENRDAFKKNLMQVSKLLKLNRSSFRSSICLVANKVESNGKTDEQQVSKVCTFLRVLKKFLISEKCDKDADFDNDTFQTALEILSYLQDGRVGILRRPSKSTDDPWELDDLNQNFIDLRRLIFQELQFTEGACDKLNITVAPETLLWIEISLLKQSNRELKTSLLPIIKGLEESIDKNLHRNDGNLQDKISRVIAVGKTIISDLTEMKSEEDVLSFISTFALPEQVEELIFCLEKMKFIYAIVGKNEKKLTDLVVGLNGRRNALIEDIACFVKFYEILCDCAKYAVQCYEILLKNKEIIRRMDDLEVDNFKLELHAICADFGFNTDIAKRAIDLKDIFPAQISDFKEYMKMILKNEYSIEKHENVFFVLGKTIILSQQLKLMNISLHLIHQIVFAATQVIVIDCDLTLENTHLVLVAPLIEIVNEKRVIKLIGESGAQHKEQKAKSSNNASTGANGLNGNNGFSSGSCKIIALDISNPHLLEIVSLGGNGSDGQDGGDGYSISCDPPDFCGRAGESAFRTVDFLKDVKNDFHSVKIVRENHPVYELRIENHPDLTVKPSDGGQGGDAGLSAVATGVEMHVKNSCVHSQVKFIQIDGIDGAAGRGGSGGKARGMFQNYTCTVVERKTEPEAPIDQGAVNAVGRAFGGIGGLITSIISATISVFTSGSNSWEMVISHTEEPEFCGCDVFLSSDGKDGSSPENSNTVRSLPRYKFKDGLLDASAVKNALENFAFENEQSEEEDYIQLIQHWKIN